ncbi:hypothetical protein [Desertibacillus haloalkaliphilus]|uniref:hypothetical protein n=1 Tax=Desertibacillus haloalkaliphilus TaxID=1328930 RepID=UPI001C25E179|nr:hypothetical protein [Desertibacillus haloalkaliphilus]MBU8907570.1 hypothetical protein [Desertibacillus haloalkaliphilus]
MEQYQKGFRLIFWGLILTFIDFTINEVSALPSFIGYLIVLAGVKAVAEQDPQVKRLKPWLNGLLIVTALSWLSLFQRPDNLQGAREQQGPFYVELPPFDLQHLASGLEMVFSLVFVTLLMNLYLLMLRRSEHPYWERVFRNRRNFYVVVHILVLFLMPLVMIGPAALALPFALLMLLNFIAFIRVLMSAYRMKKLAEAEEIRAEVGEQERLTAVFFEKKKASLIGAMVIVASWGIGFFWVEQHRLDEPLFLPTFIAYETNEHRETQLYYLHTNGYNQQVVVNGRLNAPHQTVFSYSYYALNELPLNSYDLEHILLEPDQLRQYDGTPITDVEPLHVARLEPLAERDDHYIELRSTRTSYDETAVTFEVVESFTLIDEFALPFDDQIGDYFSISWTSERNPVSVGQSFLPGDRLTFTLEPCGDIGGLASVSAPLRVEIETDEGDSFELDLTWLTYHPHFERDTIEAYLQQ